MRDAGCGMRERPRDASAFRGRLAFGLCFVRDRRAATKPGGTRPPTLLRSPPRPRTGIGQRWQDRAPHCGRGGPTACGVCAVARARAECPREIAGRERSRRRSARRSKRLAAVSRGSQRVSRQRRRRECSRPSGAKKSAPRTAPAHGAPRTYPSSSSTVRGQSSCRSRDSARSASSRPSVWHRGQ